MQSILSRRQSRGTRYSRIERGTGEGYGAKKCVENAEVTQAFSVAAKRQLDMSDEGKFRCVAWHPNDANLITRCRFFGVATRQKLNQTEVVNECETGKKQMKKKKELATSGNAKLRLLVLATHSSLIACDRNERSRGVMPRFDNEQRTVAADTLIKENKNYLSS